MYKETFSYVLKILTVIGIQCGVFLPNNNTYLKQGFPML